MSLFSKLHTPVPSTGLPREEKIAWLRLSRTENVGPVTFYRLLETYGSASRALEALPKLAARGGRKKPLVAPPLADAQREYEAIDKMGGQVICAADPDYPLALSAIEDAPPVLTVLGNLDLLNKQAVSIVGARNASANGRRFAESLARDLGKAGQVIVSGLARGIDTAAHVGSLETGTVAVVAGGIDVIYPEENRALYEQIRERGAIVAENPMGAAPRPQDFPRRNRIVSGLSAGVVVVEASLRSGSLITARLAGEQGRDVYAVPGFPMDPRAQGPNALIRDGAILIQSANDILTNLAQFRGGGMREPFHPAYVPEPPAQDAPDLPANAHDLIMENLSFSPLEVDELVRACQLSVPVIQSALLELELADRVRRHPGNRVSLAG